MGRIAHPPQIKSNIIFSHRYRYVATGAAIAVNITGASLMLAAGCVGSVVNTTVVSLYTSVRLKRIEIWSPPPLAGASSCTVQYLTTDGVGAAVEHSDTSVSPAYPAHLVSRPPSRDLSSFWQSPATTNNNMFAISCAAGSLIDVDLELILNDGNSILALAVAAAAVGQIYYLALDRAVPSNNLIPVALNTTT